jgi:predicted PurR-regulated permease PerM
MDERASFQPAPGRHRARLQAVTTVVLVLAFLKWSQAATLPLAFAVFLIALAWPLQTKLARRMPRWASLVLTVLALLAVLGAFLGALVWSADLMASRLPQYAGKLRQVYEQVQGSLQGYGLSLPAPSEGAGGGMGKAALHAVYGSVSLILLILALTILGLIEAESFRTKAESAFRDPKHGRDLLTSAHAITEKFQSYLWARTIAAVLQGVAVALLSWILGLDLALVWGLLAFLLNYIPTLGSVLAVLPPTLFALVQFDGLGRALGVLGAMSVLQLVMGNYLDPLIQGRLLKLSPVVVLISIVFWGWIWGIPGALLGVPIMVGVVIACEHFPATRWIARLLVEKTAANNPA